MRSAKELAAGLRARADRDAVRFGGAGFYSDHDAIFDRTATYYAHEYARMAQYHAGELAKGGKLTKGEKYDRRHRRVRRPVSESPK